MTAASRRTDTITSRPAHHLIAQLARIGEVGHLPAVEVVFRHALLGEALEAVGVAGGLRAETGSGGGISSVEPPWLIS
jgi:hypothetical protein